MKGMPNESPHTRANTPTFANDRLGHGQLASGHGLAIAMIMAT